SFDVACNERVQARLEDRDLSVLELSDLRSIPVDTGYDMPKIRKTGAGHEPDVAGTNHCYSHEMLSGVLALETFSTRSRAILLRQQGSRDRRIRSLPSATNGKPTSFARGPPLLILALFCQKWPCTLVDCIERALLASDLPASSGPKRATLEDHVALC